MAQVLGICHPHERLQLSSWPPTQPGAALAVAGTWGVTQSVKEQSVTAFQISIQKSLKRIHTLELHTNLDLSSLVPCPTNFSNPKPQLVASRVTPS